MSNDDKKKLPCEMAEAVALEDRTLNPPGYQKQKKFSKIMEKALDAVVQMGKNPLH